MQSYWLNLWLKYNHSYLEITSSQKEGKRTSRCGRLSQLFSSARALFKLGCRGRTDAVSEWITRPASSFRTYISSASLAAGRGRSPARKGSWLRMVWRNKSQMKLICRRYAPRLFSSIGNLFKMYSHLVISTKIEILLTSDRSKLQVSAFFS